MLETYDECSIMQAAAEAYLFGVPTKGTLQFLGKG
jgi:hypothetical protein